jgi:uncharacterized protein YcbK (DUF882 family)
MSPILLAALGLLTNTIDLARAFTQPDQTMLTFTFQNRHETQTFTVLDEAGSVRRDELERFSRFVRCWRTEKVKPMHPRLVEIVARTAEHFGVSELQIISGFRARPYGAKHSKHFMGRAMDLQVPGVPAKKVAAWVWQNFRGVGVGFYPKQEFVHVDVREDGDVRWIDGSRHGESAHARYFGRPALEQELPLDAPRLTWDEEQETLKLAGVYKPALLMASR